MTSNNWREEYLALTSKEELTKKIGTQMEQLLSDFGRELQKIGILMEVNYSISIRNVRKVEHKSKD